MISVRLHGEDELGRIADRLDDAPRHFRRELRNALWSAAKPAEDHLKRAIRTADVHGRKKPLKWKRDPVTGKSKRIRVRRFTADITQPPLRAPIARAVQIDLSISGNDPRIQISVPESSVPLGRRALVKYIVAGSKRWRHPVMGNPDVWVSQNAPNVWWKVIPQHLPRFRRNVDRALDRIARRLER